MNEIKRLLLMLDFEKFVSRFTSFGGWRLVWQYVRMGVLFAACRAVLRCAVRGRSLKEAYPAVRKRVDDTLVHRYGGVVRSAATDASARDTSACGASVRAAASVGKECGAGGTVPSIVWSAWLQGLDEAPTMVRACVESWRRELPGYDIRVVDFTNYHQWVELPGYVERKYRKGLIPPALFCDLLRLALLKRYGGVWMDASVYCSGFGNERLQSRWDSIIRSEFTVFRYFRRGLAVPVGLSNWFMAAQPGDRVVRAVLDGLLAYWRDYSCTVDYYIMHLFLGIALEALPDVAASMPRENSYHSLLLGQALAADYDEARWQELTAHVGIHKLNYRKEQEARRNPRGYYAHCFK